MISYLPLQSTICSFFFSLGIGKKNGVGNYTQNFGVILQIILPIMASAK